jgi:hypothetical protein
MKKIASGLPVLFALALTLGAARDGAASTIYVVNNAGAIYKYDGMADLAAQTPSTITGDLVGTVGGYSDDQGVTLDYNTGVVYRIRNDGQVRQYANVANWITNTGSTNISIGTNPFSNASMNRVNDLSYDGATGGYYAVGSTAANTDTPGDVLIYSDINDVRAATHDSTLGDSTYQLARVMFWSREPLSGTTVNSQDITARYFQISNAGRLEGFESLAAYAQAPNNRINHGPEGAFGGPLNTTGFQAIVAFSAPVPEPTSILLCFGAGFGLLMVRRR